MDQKNLKQKLLQKSLRPQSLVYPPYNFKKSLNSLYQKLSESASNENLEFQYCEQEQQQKLYRSYYEQPHTLVQQIREQHKERSMDLEFEESQHEEQSEQILVAPNSSFQSMMKMEFMNRNLNQDYIAEANLKFKKNYETKDKKKTLNMRIFGLKNNTLCFLYYFNLFFNLIFRVGIIVLLIFMIIQSKDIWLIGTVAGLQCFVILLYIIAMHKLLYTKSSQISIYFQKQFYPQKHYDEINLDRIMRKHFTTENMCRNVNRFISPFTKFRKNMKISVIRQELYKRMQLVLVFVPLSIIEVINVKWFDFDENMYTSESLLAMVFCLQIIRLVIHYLVIYISS